MLLSAEPRYLEDLTQAVPVILKVHWCACVYVCVPWCIDETAGVLCLYYLCTVCVVWCTAGCKPHTWIYAGVSEGALPDSRPGVGRFCPLPPALRPARLAVVPLGHLLCTGQVGGLAAARVHTMWGNTART